MLKKLGRYIAKIIGLFITICVLYVIGILFNIVPTEYKPAQIFPSQYKHFMSFLSKDAASSSTTAKFSESLYEYINDNGTTVKETNTKDTASDQSNSPVTKAQKVVDDYNAQIENQKQDLDKY